MEKISLRKLNQMRGGKEKYLEITNIVDLFVEKRINDEMKKIPEAVKIQSLIDENKLTFFNKEEEFAFLEDFGYTDSYGEDYTDIRFSQDMYDYYRYVVENYESILSNYENKKKEIESKKFAFNKKRKVSELDFAIENLKANYQTFLEVKEREDLFNKTWYKDVKFVDLNKENKQKLSVIRNGVIEKLVEECFNKNPELMLYDFSEMSHYYGEDILKAIKKEQDSRVLVAESSNKKEQKKKQEKEQEIEENAPQM